MNFSIARSRHRPGFLLMIAVVNNWQAGTCTQDSIWLAGDTIYQYVHRMCLRVYMGHCGQHQGNVMCIAPDGIKVISLYCPSLVRSPAIRTVYFYSNIKTY